MNYTTISISDLREQLPDVAERVARKGEIFAIEKWGKIKGYFVASLKTSELCDEEEKLLAKRRLILKETRGIYAKRKDWEGKSTAQIVQEIREREEAQYAKLFD